MKRDELLNNKTFFPFFLYDTKKKEKHYKYIKKKIN